MLKHPFESIQNIFMFQPPSGGCVLKPSDLIKDIVSYFPAAFGRLCVETVSA